MRTSSLIGALLALALSAALACDGTPAGADANLAADTDANADAADTSPYADADEQRPYPEPGAWPDNHGPGGPAVAFSEADIYENCAFLDGGPEDADHHNLVVMYDGYLVMPWAHEAGAPLGGGGLSFFDVSDPCSPLEVGRTHSPEMRETHSIGFSQMDGAWAVTNRGAELNQGGIQFWDISDPSAPEVVGQIDVDNFFYPDAYKRIIFSVFWQGPYVYAAGSLNGIFIFDASDPTAPEQVGHWVPEPAAQLGQIQVLGNLLVATTSEGTRSLLLDVSDPANPQPIPGGDFQVRDPDGQPREAYFSNTTNGYIYYARKEGGGGLLIYDIRDPQNPALAGSYLSDGNGGYVFVKDELAFVGESRFAAIYDLSDLEAIEEVTRLELEGDLDTATPIGNMVVLSADDDAVDGQASALAPYQKEVDAVPPRVTWSWPADGAENLALSSRIGLTFSEMVAPKSAWEGSVRLYEAGTEPAATRVDGYLNTQENIVNFWPVDGLEPGKTYTLEVPAGGVTDYNQTPTAEPFELTFSTVDAP